MQGKGCELLQTMPTALPADTLVRSRRSGLQLLKGLHVCLLALVLCCCSLGRRSFFTTTDEEQWALIRKGTAQAFSQSNIR